LQNRDLGHWFASNLDFVKHKKPSNDFEIFRLFLFGFTKWVDRNIKGIKVSIDHICYLMKFN